MLPDALPPQTTMNVYCFDEENAVYLAEVDSQALLTLTYNTITKHLWRHVL